MGKAELDKLAVVAAREAREGRSDHMRGIVGAAIDDAREAGHTWVEIGQILGVAKTTAMRRWESHTGVRSRRASFDEWLGVARLWAAEYPGSVPTRSACWWAEDGTRWPVGRWLAELRRAAAGTRRDGWELSAENAAAVRAVFGDGWMSQGHDARPPELSAEQSHRKRLDESAATD